MPEMAVAERRARKPAFVVVPQVAVDLVDPSGHVLIRCRRLLAHEDPRAWDWKRAPGAGVEMGERDGVTWFRCHACRDSERPVTSIAEDEIRDALDALWQLGTPVVRRVATT